MHTQPLQSQSSGPTSVLHLFVATVSKMLQALVQERVQDWSTRLQALNVNVAECTGDSEYANGVHDLAQADLIATTPCVFTCASQRCDRQ
jgi:broad specificity polyphosphatase/5'/3'-nucleotidase SurE